jgi:putative membrane protein
VGKEQRELYFRSQILPFLAALFLIGGAFAQFPQDRTQDPIRGQQPGQPGIPGVADPTRPGTLSQESIPMDPLASDRRFVKEAAEDGMIEVELGKLAIEKASSDSVKEFAKRMTQHHEKANQHLKEAAAKAAIETPAEMPRKGRKAREKLAKLSGADFDREYAKMMVKDHKDAVKDFEKQARSGKSPEVREFAAKTLPTLQEHLTMAEQLQPAKKE